MIRFAELLSQNTFGWIWVWSEIVIFFGLFLVIHNVFGKRGL